MGASASANSQPPPEDIADFRKLAVPSDFYAIPEVPERRKITDLKFTIIFGVFLLLLVPFLIYSLSNADIARITKGFDKCGNVCGKQNNHVDGIDCSGKDKSLKPFLQMEVRRILLRDEFINEKCVAECESNSDLVFNRCFPRQSDYNMTDFTKTLADISHDINRHAGTIVALCFIGLLFSFGMLALFRYFVTYVVWFIIVGSLGGIIALTTFFWCAYGKAEEANKPVLKGFGIIFTVFSIVLVIMLICLFKRIKLVIRLFDEAIKIIFAIPLILIEPLLTFAAISIGLFIFVYVNILFEYVGFLTAMPDGTYEFVPNGAMMFTFIFNIIVFIWMVQFIIGCQHMVIAGAISAYYFAREKVTVSSPIYNSFYNLLKYHLGTVAFGSLIITIITVIKALIRGLVNSKFAKLLIDCCLGALEDFLKYLSKNAYIQTAMHGQPFFKSGQRAVRLLAANFMTTIALNSVGDFVLAMAKVMIVLLTILVGIAMNDFETTHYWAVVFIGAFVTAVVADSLFAVFETSIDTIFLCFCEDNCMNDGMTNPYYMSVNLMQYVEDAKKTVKDKN